MGRIFECLKTPTLLILGKLEFAIPHTAWEALIEVLDPLDYILLDEDGNNSMTGRPGQVDSALIDWLNDCR